jgi:integrase-like protein
VGYALEHARGTAPMLFKKKPDEFRCAVRYAARRAGIDHCTPNDLRRTYSTWLRAAGAHLDTIAPTMGHADTRMLQRTYARLPPDLLAARLATEMGLDTGWTDQSARPATSETPETANSSELMPRGGIEPPTRGFSVPMVEWPSPREPKRTGSRTTPPHR